MNDDIGMQPNETLSKRAERYGIARSYLTESGKTVEVADETLAALIDALDRSAGSTTGQPPIVIQSDDDAMATIALPASLPASLRSLDQHWTLTLETGEVMRGALKASSQAEPLTIEVARLPHGYHWLRLTPSETVIPLIVAPTRCWLPNKIGIRGIALQLYLLRSKENWGIGDFADLRRLITIAAAQGCDVIGLNPLHQLFPSDPERCSPYAPSSRLGLNVLYICVPETPGYAACRRAQDMVADDDFQRKLGATRDAALVDYKSVAELKLPVLRAVFDDGEDRSAFRAFCRTASEDLHRDALHDALRVHFKATLGPDWREWDAAYHDWNTPEVRAFANEHRNEVEFFLWLQWVADEQLRLASDHATNAGMSVGLYRDLAVGCDLIGAENWASPEDFITGVSIGAPAEQGKPFGQDWQLPPPHPRRQRERAHAQFVKTVRANMRHAGALRIDHVMGLARLYCIPQGLPAQKGTYLHYPLKDHLAILCLESHRNRCIVIGEDLGTVPAGFREALEAANILSYRVLLLPENGAFLPPNEYPASSLAVAGNHDLPLLRAWWVSKDLDLLDRLGFLPGEDRLAQRELRAQSRTAMLKSFADWGIARQDDEFSPDDFAEAAQRLLLHASSRLILLQFDDLIGEVEPVNVPATDSQYPNWRRRYHRDLEQVEIMAQTWFG